MGQVAAKIKVMPESVDTDLEELKKKIEEALPEETELHGTSEEPIAFGLKALMLDISVSDKEGGTEEVEEAFMNVPGVDNVQVVGLGRGL
ncbi:translation elongation factor aEF-1 beta [Methanohalobium evestigatum Z-7303]|uniref:Elongation factor 1-beta n=1 Tax=Methanohalobium evestigatum (strain ATCC BAA-1072 / DSM 3721 / NBRC 107634 / OCM 161 / Z-7303) TaxID=644295 RepID=D7E6F7_METEZ|nr:elongation factor 1-beta [Methanohalobium evestigatum]ADI73179.1 translation elongation factor aEF-1 beta [Methanohalobium evestigatum Z-7303]